MSEQKDNRESFRDTLATIDTSGRRVWVYPHKPKGKFYSARTIVSWFLLLFLFGAPFVRLGGNPLLQFDVLNRKFFILGAAFWPHDFHLFVLVLITFLVFIILFTAVFGRLFCGWICPQTIFMEMVFRKIEFFIEGNGPKQRKLDQAPMSPSKFFKKAAKHSVFFLISFAIGNIFLAYIIGSEALITIITDPPSEHLVGLTFMILFSLTFYGVFARFREQACTLVCPYGRLQSVMLDSNSIVVAYDFKRGEKRAGYVRGEKRKTDGKGDCVDCRACIRVCPTGIDIRNGTQLECINCTACMDACDRIMEGIDLPTGLIRYTSHNRIEQGKSSRSTMRLVLYSAVLTVLLGLITVFSMGRSTVETTILRTTGSLYEKLEDGTIRNLYTIRVVNKSTDELSIDLRLKSADGTLEVVGPALDVAGQGIVGSVLSVTIPEASLYTVSTSIIVEVLCEGEVIEEVRTTFVGPDKR